jgi:hypothetical protein
MNSDSISIFDYDLEYLKTLNSEEKKDKINKIAKSLHNPELIKKDEAPNANIIYHLYSDGTITRQKGGSAYGRRSVIDIEQSLKISNTFFTFCLKGQYEGDTYCIMTFEDCNKLRKLMKDLCSVNKK